MNPLAEVRLTDHALERYRRRMRQRRATREEVAGLAAKGRFRKTPPDGIDLAAAHADDTYGFVVSDDVVFPVIRDGDALVAVTCLKRRRRSKEERRALREVARDAFGF